MAVSEYVPYGVDPSIYHQLYQAAGGGVGDPSQVNPKIIGSLDVFRTQLKNLTGREATPEDIQNYIQQAGQSLWQAPGDPTYGDITGTASAYIQNAFSPDIQAFQQKKATESLGGVQNTIQDLINKQTAATAANITDPTKPTYQQYASMLNNLGITPSSGAFQAGLGGALGTSAAEDIRSALGAVSLPALSGIQGLSGVGYQQALGGIDPAMQSMRELQGFGMQADLARQLAEEGQPSGFQRALGQAFSGLEAGGGAAQGVSSFFKPTYICTAMYQAGILTREEVSKLHQHLFKAFWKAPWKFIAYMLFGKFLVLLANRVNTDWNVWKPEFYDAVISEPDHMKALSLYEESFWRLYQNVKRRLHAPRYA